MAHFVPVILSGGAGTRLWPVSREALPKPFIKLPGGESLLLKTARRALACAQGAGILTITNREYFFLTHDEYETLGKNGGPFDFLLEPTGRMRRRRSAMSLRGRIAGIPACSASRPAR